MKRVKKVFAIILAALCLASCLPVVSLADGSELQFNSDGSFKILLFADSQDDEQLEETTLAFMCDALDVYEPDLVIFLGDNTVASGYDNQAKAIEAIVTPCVERDVPFAIVFGNHDQEQGVSKEDLLDIYASYGCLTYDAVPEMYGCGTCNLPILSSDGAKVAFNLWLTDSGSMNDEEIGGYDYVREDQIAWYKETAAELKAANGGVSVPSLNFQHIIVPEIYEALYPQLPFTTGETYIGKSYISIPKFSAHTGIIFENPCPPKVTAGQFDAWVETGDVLGSFFGHDHVNDFTVNYKGVNLTNVPSVGCSSYSNDLQRGVGLITLSEDDTSSYEYETVKFYDMALREGNTIIGKDGAKSQFYYKLVKLVCELLTTIHSLFGFAPVK